MFASFRGRAATGWLARPAAGGRVCAAARCPAGPGVLRPGARSRLACLPSLLPTAAPCLPPIAPLPCLLLPAGPQRRRCGHGDAAGPRGGPACGHQQRRSGAGACTQSLPGRGRAPPGPGPAQYARQGGERCLGAAVAAGSVNVAPMLHQAVLSACIGPAGSCGCGQAAGERGQAGCCDPAILWRALPQQR